MVNGRVILGYNMGFDLAVLRAEAERHGLEWSWQRALRQAVGNNCLGARLCLCGDLNALANHYGVDVDHRHRTDAVITGQIFRAMPDLKAVDQHAC